MSQNTSNKSEILEELSWIRILDDDIKVETFWEKFRRKLIENPAVPIGTVATTAALTYGLFSFYQGNKIMSQYMMRARVAAQSFTILSMALGFVIVATRQEK
ncbi:HIG1 domain family member 2A, mitochondrial [Osmia bicornis bicornis]|uniref:HIG1 domain family member 2A, mitochondrial n=1 Tax=Osmia bicornis bicornis TaxID=1437191 RepID=UPI0010F65B4B|nr:HIG1 domain family member 2A, mitochondrial [Osmia bicornis bicornis]XP_029045860.1 HIG1 domain family member 2A, mitochondrial [Osmia bicornis bicornis]